MSAERRLYGVVQRVAIARRIRWSDAAMHEQHIVDAYHRVVCADPAAINAVRRPSVSELDVAKRMRGFPLRTKCIVKNLRRLARRRMRAQISDRALIVLFTAARRVAVG